MIEARDFLDAIAGYSNSRDSGPQSSTERPVKLGTIDQYYTSGPARVLFDGESVMSSRTYSWASTYSPVAGERVFLVPVGQSYIIGGSLASTVPYNKYHDLPLASGYEPYATAFHNPSFTKTTDGVVKLAGLGKNTSSTGLIAEHTLLGTLPEGFRPDRIMIFPAPTNTNTGVGSIEVRPDGMVIAEGGIYGSWMSFNHIMFPTEELTWIDAALINGWEEDRWFRNLQYAKDSAGRVWVRGEFKETGTSKTTDTAVFVLPTGYRPNQSHYSVGTSSSAGSATSFSHFYTNSATGELLWRTGSANDDQISLDGTIFPPEGASWITPTMTGSWVSYGTGQAPGYYKDEQGLVYLRGLMKSGTINATAFTLPAGYRPSKNILRNTTSNSASARLDIQSTGNVLPIAGSNLWFSLDGIVFTAEQ